MPLTLERYIASLDTRTDLPWPNAPKVEPVKAKASVPNMKVKAVLWTVYGTLVAVPQGELLFEHPMEFVTDAAFDKVIKEFKMWNSMSRKPGAPSAYMRELFTKAYQNLKLTSGGEAKSEAIWDDIVRKLMQKEYAHDVATYGSLDDYVKKIAYFYHASIQGAGAYAGAAETLTGFKNRRVTQGLLADGQCFTPLQLQRCLRKQDEAFNIDNVLSADLQFLSAERKARKPADSLFRAASQALAGKGIKPNEVLHVGSSIPRDIAPAKKAGFRTALFAGDKASLAATPEQLKDPASRPDILVTELPQLLDVFG